MKTPCHLSGKILFHNDWIKNTEGNRSTRFMWITALKTEVVVVVEQF